MFASMLVSETACTEQYDGDAAEITYERQSADPLDIHRKSAIDPMLMLRVVTQSCIHR